MISFGQTFASSHLAITVIILCIVVVAVGVFALTQSEAVHAALDDSVEAEIGNNELGEVEHAIHDDAGKIDDKLHHSHDEGSAPKSGSGATSD